MKSINSLLTFIEKSPTPFHLVKNISDLLLEKGFSELKETEDWNPVRGGKYFVKRNNSSIIMFSLPEKEHSGFHIAASHSDSPSFKIKENPEMKGAGGVTKLNIEKYGGMLCPPWFDRPLGIGGRIFVKTSDGKIEEKLFDFEKNIALIPNLAIHMNRDANEKTDCNVQTRMLPVICLNPDSESGKADFLQMVAEKSGCKKEDILGHDLFLYNREKGFVWGANDEFISSPRLDDAECAYASTLAFLDSVVAEYSDNPENSFIKINCIFDNEEVGSLTRQGADSTFLRDSVKRISESLGDSESKMLRKIASSFLLSCDNAHAVHPNFEEKADPVNRPELNKGVVIKFNAAQKYCSDGFSSSNFKSICEKSGVPYQIYTNRSDIAGGSTLGNLSQAHLSLPSVDIGLPQWAMHSPMESAGAKDFEFMVNALKGFFQS